MKINSVAFGTAEPDSYLGAFIPRSKALGFSRAFDKKGMCILCPNGVAVAKQ